MFHINLKEIREEKGLTQEQLAKAINVVRQTVSKWERGLSMPDVDLLMKIAHVLDCTIDRLLGCSENVDMSELAIQLAILNQQFSIKNRREEQIWGVVTLVLKIIGGIFIACITFILLAIIFSFIMFSGISDDLSSGSNTYVTYEESVRID